MSKRVTLPELFPNLSEEQIADIADILHGYCAAVLRIYVRLEREHPEVLDHLMKAGTMKAKVDYSNNTN
jgi:hypothetical protein